MITAAEKRINNIRRQTVSELTFSEKEINLLVDDEIFIGKDGKNYTIRWNEKVKNYTNSYAFAMGWQIIEKDVIPGWITGKVAIKMNEVPDKVTSDLNALGRQVFAVLKGDELLTELPKAWSGASWIKILASNPDDVKTIHFMRKDTKSGRWIHKLGFKNNPQAIIDNENDSANFKNYKTLCVMLIENI